MKKLILTLSIMAITTCTFAQLGLTAGLNLASYTYAEKRFDVHRKSILAYNFGLQYKKELSEKVFLLPQLSYSLKGGRIYYDYPIGSTGPMKNLNKFHYLQFNLPVLMVFPVSDEVDYELGAGLFASYLLKATQKTVEFDDNYIERDFTFDYLKKIDVGLHFTTGLRMSKILGLYVNYDLGLTNIHTNHGMPVARTRNFSVNLSWIFAKND